jgi:hypothetical protein
MLSDFQLLLSHEPDPSGSTFSKAAVLHATVQTEHHELKHC